MLLERALDVLETRLNDPEAPLVELAKVWASIAEALTSHRALVPAHDDEPPQRRRKAGAA